MKIRLLFLLAALLLTTHTVSAAPEWFNAGKNQKYPSQFYFLGTGMGQSFDDALQQALANISRQIKVYVESEMTSVVTSYSVNFREQVKAEFKTTGKAVADASLPGAQVVENAYDDGMYYVLCVLDKDKYSRGLKIELDQKITEIDQLYNTSRYFMYKGRIFQGLESMLRAVDASTEFHTKVILYTSLTGSNYPTNEVLPATGILSQAKKILGNIRLDIMSGDNQAAKAGSLLEKPLGVQAVYHELNKDPVPMLNTRLALYDEQGYLVDRQYSNDEGKVEFWAYATGKDKGSFYVTLDMTHLPRMFAEELKNLQASFVFDILAVPPMSFSIHIVDENSERLPMVEETVAGSVEETGFHIREDAPFVLDGRMRSVESHKVQGMSGPQYVVKAELVLFLQEKNTHEKVGTLSIKANGVDKESEKRAHQQAYKKLKIPRGEMTKMLSGADDKLRMINTRLSTEALEQGRAFYNQGRYNLALFHLAQVTEGDENLAASDDQIREIKQFFADEAEKRRQDEMFKVTNRAREAEAEQKKLEVELMKIQLQTTILRSQQANIPETALTPEEKTTIENHFGFSPEKQTVPEPSIITEYSTGRTPDQLLGSWIMKHEDKPLIWLEISPEWRMVIIIYNYYGAGEHAVYVGRCSVESNRLILRLSTLMKPIEFHWDGRAVCTNDWQRMTRG